MDVDFAFICDYADVGGKINALGIGFDTIFATAVPVRHPHLHLVVQLRVSITEVGQKSTAIRLIDADGRDVIPPLGGSVDIAPPTVGTETLARLNVALHNVEFPRYGSYSLHVVVQGHEMVHISLKVATPPAPAGQ